MKKEVFVRIVLLLSSLVLAFTMLEFMLRLGVIQTLFYERLQPEGRILDPQHKLLILGDSFAYKSGELDRLLVSKLESLGYQILNLAKPGSGPLNYREDFVSLGIRYKPDTLLIGYYVGNDLSDTRVGLKRINTRNPIENRLRLLIRNTYLYQTFLDFKRAVMLRKMNKPAHDNQRNADRFSKLLNKYKVNPYLLQMPADYISFNLSMNTDEAKTVWRENKKILHEIIYSAKKNGIKRVVMVIFPHTLQVNARNKSFLKRIGFKIPDDLVKGDGVPQTFLKEFCDENEISCLNLLPNIRRENSIEFFKKYDDHLGHNGNHRVAEMIAQFVVGDKDDGGRD